MTTSACSSPLGSQELLEYWLGELDAAAEQRCDEHLFACAECSSQLGALVDLGAAVRGELERGALNIVLPESFIARVKDAGLRVREYTLDPGASVSCTITPDDDLVVSYLKAPLDDVRRLDVLVDNSVAGKLRANDVPFDPAADGLVAVTSSVFLRTLRHATQRVRLVAVDGAHERVIADYTFNHYPST
jgi:hypothetical protein